jgi:hypothetical protein
LQVGHGLTPPGPGLRAQRERLSSNIIVADPRQVPGGAGVRGRASGTRSAVFAAGRDGAQGSPPPDTRPLKPDPLTPGTARSSPRRAPPPARASGGLRPRPRR